jgi:hypothetical protein
MTRASGRVATCLAGWLVSTAIFVPAALAQSANPFVAAEFKVPATLETKEFRLRMLTVNDVVKDYDAVMTSVEHLKTVWPGGTWPEGLTFEQDLIDLGWHQKEFQRRRSFAYTVVTPTESQVTGCVYINPTPKRGYDAVVYLWPGRASSRAVSRHGSTPPSANGCGKSGRSRTWPTRAARFPGKPGRRSRTRSARVLTRKIAGMPCDVKDG